MRPELVAHLLDLCGLFFAVPWQTGCLQKARVSLLEQALQLWPNGAKFNRRDTSSGKMRFNKMRQSDTKLDSTKT